MKQRNILNRPIGLLLILLLLIVSAAVANAQPIRMPNQALEPVSRSPPTPTNVSSAYPAPAYPAPATNTPQAYPYPPPVTSTPPAYPYPYPAPATNTPTNNISIQLESGWNLVNIQATSSDISQLLASIAGHYDLLYAYDACDVADSWKKYDPNAPPFANDLNHINVGAGLWIHMTTADTLELSQRAANPTTISLCTGWNLVGYPSSQPLPVADALVSIDGAYELIYSYDAANTDDPWAGHNPNAPPFANDLKQIQPGQAYWIKSNQDATWTINN